MSPQAIFVGAEGEGPSMTEEQHPNRGPVSTVYPGQPLIDIVLVEDGQEVTHYFVDEADADAAVAAQTVADAPALAGVWSDLDWDELVEELDRIRHNSIPTSPIDEI